MDKKTFEYLKTKTDIYKGFEERKSEAETSIQRLNEISFHSLSGYKGCINIPADIRGKIASETKKLLEEYIIELNKKMEGI